MAMMVMVVVVVVMMMIIIIMMLVVLLLLVLVVLIVAIIMLTTFQKRHTQQWFHYWVDELMVDYHYDGNIYYNVTIFESSSRVSGLTLNPKISRDRRGQVPTKTTLPMLTTAYYPSIAATKQAHISSVWLLYEHYAPFLTKVVLLATCLRLHEKIFG